MRAAFAVAVWSLTGPLWAQAQPHGDLYLSPAGDDAWSGTLPEPNGDRTDGPFATLARARAAVATARVAEAAPRPCTVLLRGGVYTLEEPLVFTPADSGSAAAPITYAAYGEEQPVISGGRAITGWRPGPGELWTADLPEVREGKWEFHQLWVDGRRRQRARHPNEGYLRTAGPLPTIENPQTQRDDPDAKLGFTYREGDLRPWPDLSGAMLWLYNDWDTSTHWIASLDEANRTVRFRNPSGWPVCFWERDQRYHLENVREALDQPGEWYLDTARGELFYWPLPGETPDSVTAVAPRLRRLVELRGEGEAGLFVEHLAFRGLSFQHADWVLDPDTPAEGQAAWFLEAAVLADGARHCRFERCEVAHVGEYALWLRHACQDNTVSRGELRDLGGGGVRIGESEPPPEEPLQTKRNRVDNCFIHDGGHVFPAGVGIWVGAQSGYNELTHNEICDLYYSGISVGWSWGYAENLCDHNLIALNHIHHLGRGVLSELSCIYTLGLSEGTVIRDNVLHDTYDYRFGSWGIGLDEGTSQITVEGNLLYDHGHGFGLHYGTGNVLANNVIAFCRQDAIGVGRVEEHPQLRMERNVVVADDSVLLAAGWRDRRVEAERNLYWDTVTRGDLDLDGLFLDEWWALGRELGSLVADPQFVDAANRDLHLLPTSPAWQLGVAPPAVETAGLYGEPEWVEAPRRIVRAPLELPPRPPARLRELEEDFEGTAVGEAPPLGAVSGETGGALVRVTDEAAAGGQHSLLLLDAPNLEATWQPHYMVHPNVVRGVSTLAFDVRLGAGAILAHQWRDWSVDPFKTGPTLRLQAGGDLTANERTIGAVPVDQWVHIEIACPIGRDAADRYRLSVTLPGGEPQVFDELPVGVEPLRKLTWIGFISDATEQTRIYLDNVKLTWAPREP